MIRIRRTGGIEILAAKCDDHAPVTTVVDFGSPEYRIHLDEPCGAGVRRLTIGRIDDALSRLATLAESPGQTVHETRKDIKRVRSALRLVRDGIGSDAYQRENALFRAAGHLLGPARDAEIKIETLDAEQSDLDIGPDQLRSWRDELRRERSEQLVRLMDELTDEIIAILETGKAGIYTWHVHEIDWPVAERGHERVHKRGQERLERVRSDPVPENVHGWRRRAKDLRHHLEIFGERAAGDLERAHKLTDILGDHNNLAVLKNDSATRATALGPAGIEAVGGALDRRMAALVSEAIELGRPLYDRPPSLARPID